MALSPICLKWNPKFQTRRCLPNCPNQHLSEKDICRIAKENTLWDPPAYDKQSTVNHLYKLLHTMQFRRARKELQALLYEFPFESKLHQLTARTYDNIGDREQARWHYEYSLLLNPLSPSRHAYYGYFLFTKYKDEVKNAVDFLEKGVHLDPQNSLVHGKLGQVLAVILSDISLWSQLPRNYVQNIREHQKDLKHLEISQKLRPNSYQTAFQLGVYYQEKQMYGAASDWFRYTLECETSSNISVVPKVKHRMKLAECLVELGHLQDTGYLQDACSLYEECLSLLKSDSKLKAEVHHGYSHPLSLMGLKNNAFWHVVQAFLSMPNSSVFAASFEFFKYQLLKQEKEEKTFRPSPQSEVIFCN